VRNNSLTLAPNNIRLFASYYCKYQYTTEKWENLSLNKKTREVSL